MLRSRFLIALCAALYFSTLIGLAFVVAPGSNGRFWLWTTVAFVPVGAFLVGMFGSRRWWVALGFSVVAAAWLEAAQTVWMPAGYAAVVDIVLASIGAGLGVCFAVVVSQLRERAARAMAPAPPSAPSLTTTRRACASQTTAPHNLDR